MPKKSGKLKLVILRLRVAVLRMHPQKSLFSLDNESCESDYENESRSSVDDVAWTQPSTSRDTRPNDLQSNAARNSFFWYQITAFFTPKFPTVDYS